MWWWLAACGGDGVAPSVPGGDSGDPVEVEVPGHNDCLPVGEAMSDATCRLVVEVDGRMPTTSQLSSGGPMPTPDDPRLDDPDYQWLETEIERCTCVCCHRASYGGPGVHRWDLDFEPVWIDSASNWTLGVFVGDTREVDQTLPSSDPARLRRVIDRELERRAAFE